MKETENGLASVIIPCFNAAEFIGETIDSILAQDYEPIEIIVVDDGSKDHSVQVVGNYDDDRVRLIKSAPSGGPSRPRNIAISHARGEFLFFCDSEDVMQPGKMRKSIEAYSAARAMGYEPGLVFTDFNRIDEAGGVVGGSHIASYPHLIATPKLPVNKQTFLIEKADAYLTFAKENFIGTSSVMIPLEHSPCAVRFREDLRNSEDAELWFKICRERDIVYLDIVAHSYRRHRNNITGNKTPKTYLNQLEVLQGQLALQRKDSEIYAALLKRVESNRYSLSYCRQVNGDYLGAVKDYLKAFAIHRKYIFLRGSVVALTLFFITPFWPSVVKR